MLRAGQDVALVETLRVGRRIGRQRETSAIAVGSAWHLGQGRTSRRHLRQERRASNRLHRRDRDVSCVGSGSLSGGWKTAEQDVQLVVEKIVQRERIVGRESRVWSPCS